MTLKDDLSAEVKIAYARFKVLQILRELQDELQPLIADQGERRVAVMRAHALSGNLAPQGGNTMDQVVQITHRVVPDLEAVAKPAPKPAPARTFRTGPVPPSQAKPKRQLCGRPLVRDKPLSDDEIAEALERDARGETPGAIAKSLGRSGMGFHLTLRGLRSRALREAEDAEAEDAEAEDPEWWWPHRDLKLAEMLIAGEGIGAASAALGVDRDQALRRWNTICPEKTLDAQAALLRVLRARVSQVGVAAAE